MGFSAFVGCVLLVAGWSWSRFGRLLLSSVSPPFSLSACLVSAAVAAAAASGRGRESIITRTKKRSYGMMINYFHPSRTGQKRLLDPSLHYCIFRFALGHTQW
ncbi:hypothetical protein EV127DRAFT_439396 [Xylaria flabelliformis]|nr:hypothetical protein EV127DRAFT_439396 [Xylaria flabelliformis]